jgi:uncharacterized protein
VSVRLRVIRDEIAVRCASTEASQPDWPCKAGCDDCCRSLAAVPEISQAEWEALELALSSLGEDERAAVERAVEARRQAGSTRPIVCPLLGDKGLCRVYEARPLACRTYGFYADHEGVLGCHRILARAEDAEVVWGNHEALMRSAGAIAERRSLLDWLATPSNSD